MYQEGHQRRDSYYESDPDSAGPEHDAFNDDIANASDTEIPNSTPGSLASNEDRKSTRLNSSHLARSRMPSSA